jgi:hypothetical protein
MADQAFALSPISARSAQPDETDYEAIREAFMETARGRWFLGEYAKRNRNADTRMVLDEVARIEQTLEALQQSTPDTRLAQIFATIRNVVDQATEVAASAADGLAIDERLTPIRKGARILKEISWRWREIGAESRICDSIESQVDAIAESCSQIARVDTRATLATAFELMTTKLEALAEENGLAFPPAAGAAAKFYSAAATVQVAREDDTLACTMKPAPDSAVSIQETYLAAVVAGRAETAYVREKARLGTVAIELATLAANDDHSCSTADGDRVEGGCAVPPATQPTAPPSRLHPALGSTPFTTEFLEPRRPRDTDPAAAICRMSLTEKIAFFA